MRCKGSAHLADTQQSTHLAYTSHCGHVLAMRRPYDLDVDGELEQVFRLFLTVVRMSSGLEARGDLITEYKALTFNSGATGFPCF